MPAFVIEHTIGQFKGCWWCLLYTPQNPCCIVLACGLLHNVANLCGVSLLVDVNNEEPDPGPLWGAICKVTLSKINSSIFINLGKHKREKNGGSFFKVTFSPCHFIQL
ncbi:hypothetical protein ILYODFUR_005141 [Ilyodon furcidens]|uniref:Uncharacterized protein n=1 Tax=Ilyodon furcidens TaxID=33524 RepID=A0ABV0TTC1_9TELE